jgi:RNA ligase (TIGR02306 family)
MSTLVVEVSEITNIKRHENSDNLDVGEIKGWQVVIKRGQFVNGEKLLFIPPDALIPRNLAVKLGVANYLGVVRNNPEVLKVKAVRLRGEPSYGLTVNLADVGLEHLEVGTDVKEILGITKFEPPAIEQGDAASDLPAFHRYTDIENINNYPNVLTEDDDVIITEKIHGTNFRGGLVTVSNEQGEATFEFVAGSHRVRRKRSPDCLYWLPMSEDSLLSMLSQIQIDFNAKHVIVFGEIFGVSIQDMTYGCTGKEYRLFDISVDGRYLNYDEFVKYTTEFSQPIAPVLYEGKYSKAKLKELTDGPTTLCPADKAGKFKGREGVVVRLRTERHDRKLGRVILKSVSVDYLSRRGGTDSH